MAQKLISRINQRAHYSKNEDRPEVAELIKLIIKCMDEKEEFYLEEVKGLTRALLPSWCRIQRHRSCTCGRQRPWHHRPIRRRQILAPVCDENQREGSSWRHSFEIEL